MVTALPSREDTEPGLQACKTLLLRMIADPEALLRCFDPVHRRSQIDTHAGLLGWDVPQIFDRCREQVGLLHEEQERRHSPQSG